MSRLPHFLDGLSQMAVSTAPELAEIVYEEDANPVEMAWYTI
jgi:hypothetical protein